MKNLWWVVAVATLVLTNSVAGQQWKTFRSDSARSGATNAEIEANRLELAWQWSSPVPPNPAWDGPARWDAYAQIRDLPAMRQYDACFQPVSDGETVYFGSSSQDTLTALNLNNGTLKWNYAAGGPIRLAPTIAGDRVLFGCDDGNAYCVDRTTGALIWKFNPSLHSGGDVRRLINNDRLISYFPIRTGITVRDGMAYFGASFLPWRESYICSIDVESGKLVDDKPTFVVRHEKSTLEGNLLVAEDRLIVPQGRVAPRLFERSTGKSLGDLPGGGGVNIVLTDTDEVVRAEGGSAARAGQIGVFQGKERVASFPRGRSIVVSGDHFYVIDRQKIFAAGRMTNELKWSCDVDEPLELIKAGESLFVGGRDHVTAIDSSDGSVLWSAETDGRVFGLAVADGRLIASTDTGSIHVYAPTGDGVRFAADDREPGWDSPSVARVREKDLIHRWVFHRSAMKQVDGSDVAGDQLNQVVVTDQAAGAELRLEGRGKAIRIGDSTRFEAIELQDAYFPIDESLAVDLPDQAITVEAWVRVDEAQDWGGIAGCIQDDGSVEHGWILGYRNDRFCFGLAGSESGLTYLTAPKSFELASWNHVVGTYDGRAMRLYVNGSLAATSAAESGPISYAEKRYFTVAAYRDVNELFPLRGAIHEVRVYSKTISAVDVDRTYQAAVSDFPAAELVQSGTPKFVSWGPFVRFTDASEVEVTYGTKEECSTVIDLILDDGVKRFFSRPAVTEHRIRLDGLPHRRVVQYQIREENQTEGNVTESYSLDTHFDWSSTPAVASASTKKLVEQCSNPRGLVYVVGASQADRAKVLALESQFNVVLIVELETEAIQIRKRWLADDQVRYGQHLCVMATPLNQLPAAAATLVMSTLNDDQTRRLVRPHGGVLHDGQNVVWSRGSIEGAGVWSHMYGQADNSAFGGEELSNASDRKDLVTQWIGRPGPRYQTDRQNRKPSPLAAGGRLFLQGQQRMIALDSFSGTVLWSVESPTVMRWNVPHDCSNWCADEDGVFVAAEHQAWFIDGKVGQVTRRFDIPIQGTEAKGKSWGYISRYGDQLIGSVVDSSAIYRQWWGKSHWFDSTGGNDTHVVAGEQLFSLHPESGKLNWRYEGLVLHPTITIMGEQIFFVETQTASHLDSKVRRVSLDEDQSHVLVCLDVATGKTVWRRPISAFEGHLASLYLAGGGDEEHRCLVMAASESTKSQFSVEAFEPETGDTIWTRAVKWEANHHGKHISRPAIQGELVYLRPEVLSLADGSTIHRGFPGGHGCSSYTLASNGMFSRLGETTWWDVRTQKVNRFDRIRTDCWISVVPAQGMVLSAEGGGGCSCGTWLETSLGFLPRSVDEALPEK